MPRYEYHCDSCGENFEAQQRMSEDPLADCILCGASRSVHRLVSGGTGLIFKGTGFYITDYKGNNASSNGSNGAASAESKTETASKTETKSTESKPAESTPAKSSED